METEQCMSWATTHVGTVRTLNEDAWLSRPELGMWAVADGAGGHAHGDRASRAVIEALEFIPPHLSADEMLAEVRQRIAETHAALRLSQDDERPEISASTVVMLIARGDHYACLWAGDSRCYLLRDGELLQVTRDHSLVQELVDAGEIMPDEADTHPNANVITRAVGADGSLDLDKVSSRLALGDRFLLCSDGLCKAVSDEDIAELLASPLPTERLVEAALANNGRDNVTAVAVEMLAVGDEPQD